ncbi:MAG: DUF2796 domain-containing protein [Pseudomonadota bacterium]
MSEGFSTSRLAASLLGVLVWSANADEGAKVSLDAHEHGKGVLEVVLEGEELSVLLRMPGVNVVGFEHEPGNDAERTAIRDAVHRFEKGVSYFEMPSAAECKVENVRVQFANDHSDHAHEHDKHDDHAKHEEHGHGDKHDDHAKHDGHGHGDKHDDHAKHDGHGHGDKHDDHAKHDGHGHGDKHDDHAKHDDKHKDGHDDDHKEAAQTAHSELVAAYAFHCHEPQKLEAMVVNVFDALQGAEAIDALVVTDRFQGQTTLEPAKRRLALTR